MTDLALYKTAAAIAAIAAGGYCISENRRLKTTEYAVSFDKLPQSFSGKRILHLSDLHTKKFGNNYDILINSCNAAKPDYIFFTGDLYSRKEENLDKKPVLMKRLRQIAPVYYVFGNHEAETPDKAEALAYRLEQEGIHVLRNGTARLFAGDDYINVYGADIDKKYYKNSSGSYANLPKLTARELSCMMGDADNGQFNILLAHTPFPFEEYAEWGADLVFSGHCHGGAIRLPIIGGILSPERKFFPKYTKGVYSCDKFKTKAKMIVSAGLGKFRLGNPAEIVIVTLKNERNV